MLFRSNLARRERWAVAVASFEMRVVPYVTDTIMSTYLGSPIKYAAPQSRVKATDFVQKMFTFIAPDRTDNETEHDIDWLLDKMQVAVIREGSKVVLIDPFNEIEHRKRVDESMTEYVGRAIRKLKAFAMQYQVLVILVAHPTKSAAQFDSSELSLYNIADSAHFANKADLGVIEIGRAHV